MKHPLLVLALLGAAGWWFTRPKPIEVVVHEVGRGLVEATLSNTRAGEIEACQRTKMATIVGGRIEWLGVYPSWQSLLAQLTVAIAAAIGFFVNTRTSRALAREAKS